MTPRKQPHPNQGSMFEPQGPVNYEVAGSHYGRVELAPGVFEGDSSDITRYLGFYVDAIREIGRGRSNDLGFGELYVNSKPVKEVAFQHDNPDNAQVQRTVIDSRVTHFNKANSILLKRARIREKTAASWQREGVLNQIDIEKLPLIEDASMLEGKWYGKPNEISTDDKTDQRKKLYRYDKKYRNNLDNAHKAA